MDKAIKTTKLKCKLGHTTLVLTEKGEFLSASAMIRNVSAVTPRKPGS